MGWHLDGKVTAVVGTHTHVQTADERILPKGTAYLTDVGMTGPHDSVIGVEIEPALGRFLTGMPARFETATGNPRLNARRRRRRRGDRAARRDIERLSYGRDELDAARPTCVESARSEARSHDDLFDLPFEDRAADAERPPRPAPSRRVLTVTELTVRVRDLLEDAFFEVWVEGELSNCRVWNTGHLYFTLKDAAVADHAASCSARRCAT